MTDDHKPPTVARQFKLAQGWRLKGNLTAAIAGYQRVLDLDPTYAPAYVEWAGLLLRQGQAQAALDLYHKALALTPDDATLRLRYTYVKHMLETGASGQRLAETPHATLDLPAQDNPHGKIDLRDQTYFKAHRSGWGYALRALTPLHNRRGVLFDGFIERNFAWRHWQPGRRPPEVLDQMRREGTFEELATSEERGLVPYTRPWVGVLHNPHNMPTWFHYQEAPQTIFAKEVWQASLATCVGLFTLSEYHAQWVRAQTGKPVSVLRQPTEIPPSQFSFPRFRANPHKQIVQIGWWLRKLSAIYQLPLAADNPLGYTKVRLVPRFFSNADQYLRDLIARERAILAIEPAPEYAANTRETPNLPDAAYDALLAENIAFVELYDASLNNAVIECLARATPLLINPLPAVVEYLGPDYPLYFHTLAEAAAKALDLSLLHAAHIYLRASPMRATLSPDYFRHSVETSEVYRLL